MAPFQRSHRAKLRRFGGRLAKRIARRGGFELVRSDRHDIVPKGAYELVPKGQYDVVRRDYYSPVPNLDRLPVDIWTRRKTLGGVDLKVEAGVELIEKELAGYVKELRIPVEGPVGPGHFFLRNGNYESVDAELLYAMLRARKPRLVMELGSGFTTLLIGQAARRNHAEGIETQHLAYDPFPRSQILGDKPPPPTRFEPISATDVPIDAFGQLGPGDILFVDTTHTVKLGSDVNYIILDVLPTLASGVIVHFHDIFLPWEYPRQWFEEMQYYWAEQYLLQAFLAYNSEFEVLIPAAAIAQELPERLGAVVPSFSPGIRPGAIWLQRR
jgi:methyltransferase family protein